MSIRFFRAGGLDQIRLENAADLAAIPSLDHNLWVALACPVKGLEIDDASLACLELKTGKIAWRTNPEWTDTLSNGDQSRQQLMSTYRGNLLQVDGKYLALGELGHLLWMELTPKGYKELSRAWLFAARETWSLPVLSRGLLYVVQHSRDVLKNTPPRLLCYDLRA